MSPSIELNYLPEPTQNHDVTMYPPRDGHITACGNPPEAIYRAASMNDKSEHS